MRFTRRQFLHTSRAGLRAASVLSLALAACGPGTTPSATTGETLASAEVAVDEAAALASFARLYGYLRFFHPSDAAAATDWDAFAIEGARAVLATNNQAELQRALEQLIEAIGVGVQIYDEANPPAPSRLTGEGSLVAWQHRGLGNGTEPSPYTSVRLGREHPQPSPDWAPFVTGLDAVPLRGKTLRLRARVRTEGEGQAQLWLRVAAAEGATAFFDNMQDRPVRSATWSTPTIEAPVADDAVQILLGGMVMGDARADFDDFSLELIDGDETKPLALPNADFDRLTLEGWAAKSNSYSYALIEDEGGRLLRIQPKLDRLVDPLFVTQPALGECVDLELGAGLRVRLPIALPDSLAANQPKRSSETETSKDAVEDAAVRAAAVIAGWNVLHHFYPYFETIDEDWNAALDQALVEVLAVDEPEAVQRVLQRMVAKLHDGHGSVQGPMSYARAPVSFARIEGKVVVVAAHPSTALEPGDELRSVDGVAIDAALREATTRTAGSPQWIETRLLRNAQITIGPEDEPVELVLRRGDTTLERSLARQFDWYPVPDQPPIERLDDQVMYVDLSRAPWPDIEARLDELAAAPGVVFDVRGYPNSNHQILHHLLREPDTSKWMFVPEILRPEQPPVSWQAVGWDMQPAEPHIGGKVAFLTDARAISYAESVMGLVEGHDLGEIIGAPTAGANGNINPFTVPGGFTIVYTGMKVTRLDGRQHHIIGVEPTIPAAPTLAGLRAGRDELLELALDHVREP